MEFEHVPVLYKEVLEGLQIKPDGIYVDGTLGGGGHAAGICERLSENGTLVGIDQDAEAIAAAGERLRSFPCQKHLVKGNFEDVQQILWDLHISKINGALLDIGVSSYQLDNPERGFSYMHDAPLDMRMDSEGSLTAEIVVNEYPEAELARIIGDYGEERWAARIAKFIARERKNGRITSTYRLVDIIKAAIPASARREGPHPAKRTFQAIRIEVNDELGHLGRSIDEFLGVMAPGGRLAIISFHSLEDRIVKEMFHNRLHPVTYPRGLPIQLSLMEKPTVKKVTGKPITASPEEVESNPRSRSAKLRIIEKL